MNTTLVFESGRPAEEKSIFFEQLRSFASAQKWPLAITHEVELILEEWMANLIKYGLKRVTNPWFQIELIPAREELTIRARDNGLAFDPTIHSDPDVTKPPEERPIGGLGVFMMKKLSSDMSYRREDGRNLLVIRKSLVEPVLGKK